LKQYDYLIVGSGLFGSVFAHEMKQLGKRCLVLEKREHIGGNIYTERVEGIDIHKYGPHIFHTNKQEIWDYVNRLTFFKPFVYSPVADFNGELYNLPFNMHTFYQMWGVRTPAEAHAKIAEQQAEFADIEPRNLEEQAMKLVGRDIYEKLIKGYTEKQWGRKCTELPSFIIRRLPVRLTFDNNYFNDMFQGIPLQGYTELIRQLLAGIEVRTGVDFLQDRKTWEAMADKVVFTGRIDQYFEEKYGKLEYRSLRFEEEQLDQENYQGIPVTNYTAASVPYTRITEHKHFTKAESPITVISREYPQDWHEGLEPYYPVNNEQNNVVYGRYEAEAKKLDTVIFGGRLGTYRYYNMDQIIEQALQAVQEERH
jgi:UDP-galactopyranose mutase